MKKEQFIEIVVDLVKDACALKDRHTKEINAVVNYACIFPHSDSEYEEYFTVAKDLGSVAKDTPTGSLFLVDPIDTVAGKLRLVKVRKPDPTRTERGDADFTVADYDNFKPEILQLPGTKLIERTDMEMIELMEEGADVRVYFSNPPLDKQLGIV